MDCIRIGLGSTWISHGDVLAKTKQHIKQNDTKWNLLAIKTRISSEGFPNSSTFQPSQTYKNMMQLNFFDASIVKLCGIWRTGQSEQFHATVASRSHAMRVYEKMTAKSAPLDQYLFMPLVLLAPLAPPQLDIISWRLITIVDVALDLHQCLLIEEVDVCHQVVLTTFLGILTQCK